MFAMIIDTEAKFRIEAEINRCRVCPGNCPFDKFLDSLKASQVSKLSVAPLAEQAGLTTPIEYPLDGAQHINYRCPNAELLTGAIDMTQGKGQ